MPDNATPPEPEIVFTCKLVMQEGKPWAKVRLDVGQYGFPAGMCLVKEDGSDGVEFNEACSRLIVAIGIHAWQSGWLKLPTNVKI